MDKNYQKEYIAISTEFRTSNHSKESIGQLYDLLYELEKTDRTKNDDQTLSNIYTLLGLHQSAYELYKTVVELKNRKDAAKFYTLELKAKSHGNDFAIKDIRKLHGKHTQTDLYPEDFKADETEENKFITNKTLVIFNKTVEPEKFEINIYGIHLLEDFIQRIIEYISWLSTCKKDLIDFYNTEMTEIADKKANEDWFDTLEIFSARIVVGQNEKLFAEISCGDNFVLDHILDIQTEERSVTDMSYDG